MEHTILFAQPIKHGERMHIVRRFLPRFVFVVVTGALFATAAIAQQSSHSASPQSSHRAAPAQAPLPKNIPPVAGPVKTQYVMRYQEIKVGTGDLAAPGQIYTVNYTGWLASDGTKFDSSYDRGKPIDFPQGVKRVITGWDQGFEGMHVGGKRRLFIPYQLAYGEKGRPPVIPPKANLIFDVELVAVRDLNAPAPITPPAQQPQAAPDRPKDQ
jgi:peptidylprolyl isomerase